MIRDQDRYKVFTRRSILLAGGKLTLFSALVARMYYLQVIEADKYRTLADDNRINLRLLAPPRGRIVDRNGVELAINKQNYRLILIAERSPDVEATLDRIAQLIGLPADEHKRVLREARRKRSFMPITVRENLDWKEVARIEINAPDLPGVQIEVGRTRFYPEGEAASHLIGYVGSVSPNEQNGDPLLELPSLRIGKNGVEKVFDKRLRGKAGRSEVEVNAIGRVIRELSRNDGQPGDEIHLALDMTLQTLAHKKLKGQSGAVVVMDVKTGEIIVLASTPGFDPNAFSKGISSEYWHKLTTNERAPLINKATAGQYAPGSTFKPVVALAALESGAATPETTFFCKGYLDLGNTRFHCWKRWGHGKLNMEEALQHSCDVYFYEAARRTGVDKIAAMAHKFGLGKDPGLRLPGEKSGVIPSRNWKFALFGKKWQLGETLVTGIGQGFVLTTPVQLAIMAARIANGGHAVQPRLTMVPQSDGAIIKAAADGDGIPPAPVSGGPDMGIAGSSLDVVRRGMWLVSNSPHGTAYRSRIRKDGWHLAGKTGTSQVRRITMSERKSGVRKNKDLPWRERDHALFIAYAPAHAPRYAISVVVEHGGGGSSTAAPIAHDVMLETLKRDPSRNSRNDTREARAGANTQAAAKDAD